MKTSIITAQMSTALKIGAAALMASLLSACGTNLIPQTATSPDKALAVSLQMQKQEVKSYDCNNKLVSDEVDVVSAPTMLMEIQPTKPSWTYNNIADSAFTDVQTNDGQEMIMDHTKFTIDHGNGWLNMQVDDGVNEIKYNFTFTDGTTEAGSRFINVSYSEVILPGFSTYYPDPSTCPPNPQPSPTPTGH